MPSMALTVCDGCCFANIHSPVKGPWLPTSSWTRMYPTVSGRNPTHRLGYFHDCVIA
jgi:hypothetical protein